MQETYSSVFPSCSLQSYSARAMDSPSSDYSSSKLCHLLIWRSLVLLSDGDVDNQELGGGFTGGCV